jgi:hypothetical protein
MFGVVRRTVISVEDNKEGVLGLFKHVPKSAIRRIVSRLTKRIYVLQSAAAGKGQARIDNEQDLGEDEEKRKRESILEQVKIANEEAQEEDSEEEEEAVVVEEGAVEAKDEDEQGLTEREKRRLRKLRRQERKENAKNKKKAAKQHTTINSSERLITLAKVMMYVVVAGVYCVASYFIEFGLYHRTLATSPYQVLVSVGRATQVRLVLTQLMLLAAQSNSSLLCHFFFFFFLSFSPRCLC